ncbi:DUF2254 domain-containing protein [Mycolicibacterium moriokaense]|nr:DUF2254 domain-containing protein [Mycolicibacterium moriokaense]
MPSTRWWTRTSDAMRTRLWPLPLLGVVCALAAGIGLPAVDKALTDVLPITVRDNLFGGGAAEARELLGTVASSLITVTSLTFSLTVVTLQLASGQYSPRLLRTFARDRFVQGTLALFLAAFVYTLSVLRSVRDQSSDVPSFVPQLSITVGYLLAFVSVIGLVFFLAHLVREIRVETMMDTVRGDAMVAGRTMFAERDDSEEAAPVPAPPDNALPVTANSTGFLVDVDTEDLLSAATNADAVVLVDRVPGDWIIADTPVAFVWPADGAGLPDEDGRKKLCEQIAATICTGNERTPVQDVGYGLRQLTDVAIKALSPGINDPTTAVHAIGHSAALLSELAKRQLGSTVRRSDDGIVRVVRRHPDIADLLDIAISQPLQYGREEPAVLAELLTLLRDVGWRVTEPAHKSAVSSQLTRLRRVVAETDLDISAQEQLGRLGMAVDSALAGVWLPSLSNP